MLEGEVVVPIKRGENNIDFFFKWAGKGSQVSR